MYPSNIQQVVLQCVFQIQIPVDTQLLVLIFFPNKICLISL